MKRFVLFLLVVVLSLFAGVNAKDKAEDRKKKVTPTKTPPKKLPKKEEVAAKKKAGKESSKKENLSRKEKADLKSTPSKVFKKDKKSLVNEASPRKERVIKPSYVKEVEPENAKPAAYKPLVKKTATGVPVEVKPNPADNPRYKQPAMAKKPMVLLNFAQVNVKPYAWLDMVCSRDGWIFITLTLNNFEAVFAADFAQPLKLALGLQEVHLYPASAERSAGASLQKAFWSAQDIQQIKTAFQAHLKDYQVEFIQPIPLECGTKESRPRLVANR